MAFELSEEKGQHGRDRILKADSLEEMAEKLGAKIGDDLRLPGEDQ